MRNPFEPRWGYVKAGLVGAVVAAVVLVSFPVVAAVGANLILGKANSADAVTSLSGTANTNLRLENLQPGSPALDLRVTAGAPPLKVNSTARVPNLNADRLDGKHASAFLLAGGTAADADLLDGQDSSQFALAIHDHAGTYLPAGGTALNAETLDGFDSSAFCLAGHGHAGEYLPLGGTAANAEMLDNLDSSAFAAAFHNHDAADFTSGLLSADRFSAYGDLGVEGILNNDNPADLLTRSQADARFLNEGDTAANSSLLDGLDSTAFAAAGHSHAGVYLPEDGTAQDARRVAGMAPEMLAARGALCAPGTNLGGLNRTGPACSASIGSVLLDSQGDIGWDISLILDAFARPVIAYYDGTNGDLKLMRCDDPACLTGTSAVAVDTAGDVGRFPSLVLNHVGIPAIAYYDVTNGDLKLAYCWDETCSAYTTFVTVDGSGADVGWYPSLAVGGDMLPVVAYYDTTNGDLKLARCATPMCTSGVTIATLDAAGDVGVRPSLALDAAGNPAIAYRDFTNDDLKLLRCSDAACSPAGVTITLVDSTGDVGGYPSMVLDAADRPVIAYRDITNGELKLVHCGDPICGAGNAFAVLDASGNGGFAMSLLLDAAGRPVVSYNDNTSSSLRLVRCGDADCSAGNTLTVVDGTGRVGAATSLALDPAGHALIAYFDEVSSGLRLAGVFD